MSYTYTPSNAVESKKLDRSSVSLQATYILNKIIGLFVSTFLVSYITQVNREAPISVSLTSIGLFFVMHNIIFALIYLGFGIFCIVFCIKLVVTVIRSFIKPKSQNPDDDKTS